MRQILLEVSTTAFAPAQRQHTHCSRPRLVMHLRSKLLLLLLFPVQFTNAVKFLCRLPLFRLLRFCKGDTGPAPKPPSSPVASTPMAPPTAMDAPMSTPTASAPTSAICGGTAYFDKAGLAAEFNLKVFLYQPPVGALVPSTVYKFEDLMSALKKLQTSTSSAKFWLGDDCGAASQKAAYVNMAAFLGQAIRESIIFNACDENNYDVWRPDPAKDTGGSTPFPAVLYPMSSGCGQLGRKYGELTCDDACPLSTTMEMTATTNGLWDGAPPPLICGPRSKYSGLGYWNPLLPCQDATGSCDGQPFSYPSQKSGVYVPVSKDNRYPQFYYANPLPGQAAREPPRTNVDGCCWWGRGVIQTTGRCNYGILNKQIGAGAGSNAVYPAINFCTNPQAICSGPLEVKWVAGMFFSSPRFRATIAMASTTLRESRSL
jgi:hypothetical protein